MKHPARFLVCLLLSVSALAQEKGTIFVVRHAERQSNAEDSPLSPAGEARAKCLAQTLRDAQIKAVFVNQYLRTKQTAAPILQESKAREAVSNANATAEIVKAARTAADGGNVLIVGHSNTIPNLLKAFGTPLMTVPDTVYDQLFVFNAGQPKQLLILHYCPSLPMDTTVHPANSMAKP